MSKPNIAIIPGDPSGIGSELIAKLLQHDDIADNANILLIGDAHLWQNGASQANIDITLNSISIDDIAHFEKICHFDMHTISRDDVKIAKVSEASGYSSLRCLDKALDFARDNYIDGILFAPFNKASLTKAKLNAEDEHQYMARYLNYNGYHGEINVLDDMMTTRVTSHIGLKDVVANISKDGIINAVNLAYDTLKKAGHAHPRIAVAALNPHAGDHGKFGREEIDIIEPAIKQCQEKQMNVTGPWPSDTVFLKAKNKEIDAVVTMYHDQGQIAIKLMGFDKGVTVAGGLPIPVATPAHGTAFDIAGKNLANVSATRKAFDLLLRMATTYRKGKDKS